MLTFFHVLNRIKNIIFKRLLCSKQSEKMVHQHKQKNDEYSRKKCSLFPTMPPSSPSTALLWRRQRFHSQIFFFYSWNSKASHVITSEWSCTQKLTYFLKLLRTKITLDCGLCCPPGFCRMSYYACFFLLLLFLAHHSHEESRCALSCFVNQPIIKIDTVYKINVNKRRYRK